MNKHRKISDLRSPLARARGFGSAKEGVQHWWAQRLTAVALVPLTLWLVAAMVALAGADHEAVTSWIRRPASAVLLVLLIAATFHHAQLGLQVVIEDYAHTESIKIVCLLAVKGLAVFLTAVGIFAVLKIAL